MTSKHRTCATAVCDDNATCRRERDAVGTPDSLRARAGIGARRTTRSHDAQELLTRQGDGESRRTRSLIGRLQSAARDRKGQIANEGVSGLLEVNRGS